MRLRHFQYKLIYVSEWCFHLSIKNNVNGNLKMLILNMNSQYFVKKKKMNLIFVSDTCSFHALQPSNKISPRSVTAIWYDAHQEFPHFKQLRCRLFYSLECMLRSYFFFFYSPKMNSRMTEYHARQRITSYLFNFFSCYSIFIFFSFNILILLLQRP